jgi:hypothetical protein
MMQGPINIVTRRRSFQSGVPVRAESEWSRFSRDNREEEVVFRTTPLYTGHRALTIAGFLAIAVGAVHLGLTFLAYRPVLKLTALWFAGTGVAIVLIGVVTLLARNAPAGSMERWMAAAANAAGLVIAFVYEMLNEWREPRGYVEIALFSMGLVAALRGGEPVSAAAPAESPRRV